MEELMSELLDELKIELMVSKDSDIAILEVKLKNAIREVENAIGFLPRHDSEYRLNELKTYTGQIKDLTMYDYSIVGGEGQTEHSENYTKRVWKDRKECFNGIVRYAD